MKTCNECGIITPDNTKLCDCGYDFNTLRRGHNPLPSPKYGPVGFFRGLVRGRLSGAQYFARVMGTIIGSLALLAFIVKAAEGTTSGPGIAVIMIGYVVARLFVLILQMRRAHDLNKPATYALLTLVPLFGILIGMQILFQRGTQGGNRFGPDPLD